MITDIKLEKTERLSFEKYLSEAFRKGRAPEVVQKIANVLGRRVGINIFCSTEPIEYENFYGKFAGYMAYLGNGNRAIRFNFLLGRNDQIVSVDYYDRIANKPSHTLDLNGMNIIQVLNEVGDFIVDSKSRVISASKEIVDNYLEKRVNAANLIQMWLKADRENLSLIQDERLKVVYDTYFYPWADSQGDVDKVPSFATFSWEVKKYLASKKLTNKFFRNTTVKKGSREKQIIDKSDDARFSNIFRLTGDEQFDQLRKYCRLITRSVVNSLFIYGISDVGKSHDVYETLNEENVDYELYKGGVKNVEALVKLLYLNRDNTILLFDDFDDALKSKSMANVLKAALEDKYSRYVSYVQKAPMFVKEDGKRVQIPDTFEFTSAIIFISNYSKIDPAVKNRSMTVKIDLSKEEILKRIEDNLKDFPNSKIPMRFKMEVLNFLKSIVKDIKRIGFRSFKMSLANRLCDEKETGIWKKWTYANLTM